MNLQEAVKLALDGKEEGYNYLYQQTYQKSYYVSLKYMKQEDTALDVLQDAYIKAFQNLAQLQDADKFPAWFSKIVATKALDELKKRKVILFSQMEKDNDMGNIEEMFQDDRIDTQPEISLDKAETSRLVKEMIDTLSDEQRLCIMMYYVEEMAVKDIAEALDISENTVKSRLNYGRKNIKEKVLELEKKGTKLYTLAPVPFFLYLLLSDTSNAQACELPINILEIVSKEAMKAHGVGTGKLAQIGGKIMTKKVIIGIVSAVVIGGGAIGGILAYNNYQNNQAQEAMADNIANGAENTASTQDELKVEMPKETEKTTETEAPEPTPEVTPEPVETKPEFTFTDLNLTMYAKSTVNVRSLPNADGKKLGGLSKAQEVSITGQCNETSWYRISYNGNEAFVSNSYLVSEKPVTEVAQQPQEQPVQQQPSQPETPVGQPKEPEQPAQTKCPVSMYTVLEDDNSVWVYIFRHTPGESSSKIKTAIDAVESRAFEKFGTDTLTGDSCAEHIDWNGQIICKYVFYI